MLRHKVDWASFHTIIITLVIMTSYYFDGLVQDCSNSSALARELLQSCAEPSISLVRYLDLNILLSSLLHRIRLHNSVTKLTPQIFFSKDLKKRPCQDQSNHILEIVKIVTSLKRIQGVAFAGESMEFLLQRPIVHFSLLYSLLVLITNENY